MTGDGAKKQDGEDSEPPERPTVVPAFDLDAFAREAFEASEIRRRPPSFRHDDTLDDPPSEVPASTLIRRALGPPESIPALVKSVTDTLASVPDPKSAFVVGFIDGVLPLEVLVEAIGLAPAEVTEIVKNLVEQGLVVLREPPAR